MTTNLINKETFEKWKDNNADEYGGACVQVAENVIKYLDEHPNIEFNIGYYPDMTTPHGIICDCDDAGGITGFMASFVNQMIAVCYKDGWKFWLACMISPITVKANNTEEIERIIEKITNSAIQGEIQATPREILHYSEDLIKRYKESFGRGVS